MREEVLEEPRPGVYQDLLVFEASLRQEHTRLARIRFKYLLFCAAIAAWVSFFFHGIWISPSEVVPIGTPATLMT